MKCFLITLCTLLAIYGAAGQSALQIALANNAKIVNAPVKKTASVRNVCDVGGLTCSLDKVTICIGGKEENFACSDAFGSANKYCNCERSGCVATRPVCADLPAEQETCTSLNTKFPDNTDCSKFSYCDAGGKLTRMQCATGFSFHPKEKKCVDKAAVVCRTIACPLTGIAFLPFTLNPNYYVQCFKGEAEIMKCKEDQYHMISNICQFGCTAVGYFTDPIDKATYHICTTSGGVWKKETYKCGTGLEFNQSEQICEAGKGGGGGGGGGNNPELSPAK